MYSEINALSPQIKLVNKSQGFAIRASSGVKLSTNTAQIKRELFVLDFALEEALRMKRFFIYQLDLRKKGINFAIMPMAVVKSYLSLIL